MTWFKDFTEAMLGIIIAFLLYTVLSKFAAFFVLLVNIFSLVVIYFGVKKGEIYGACIGMFCGLIMDTFSIGVFGVAGISMTIMGYLAGYFSKKMNVIPSIRMFVFIFILVSLQLFLWAVLYSFIFSEMIYTGKGMLFFQPAITAFVGLLIFNLLNKLQRLKLKHE